jgi:hypothetical protein
MPAVDPARRFFPAWAGAAGVLALGLALAGCTSTPAEPPVNVYPSDYKKEIIKSMGELLEDLANIRDAGVTAPALMRFGAAERYASCVRFNPLKTRTEYYGIQRRLAIFHSGQLSQFPIATPEQCGNAAYQPFPELEKICVRERC